MKKLLIVFFLIIIVGCSWEKTDQLTSEEYIEGEVNEDFADKTIEMANKIKEIYQSDIDSIYDKENGSEVMKEIREFTSLEIFNNRELNNKEMEIQIVLSELQLYLLNDKPATPFDEKYQELMDKLNAPTD